MNHLLSFDEFKELYLMEAKKSVEPKASDNEDEEDSSKPKMLYRKGEDAKRHTEQYVKPNAVDASDTSGLHLRFLGKSKLSLPSEMKDDSGKTIPKGSKLVPIKGSHRVDSEGVHHSSFHVLHPNGRTVSRISKLPHHKVAVENNKSGKHNDEHAVMKVWNHFSSNAHKGPDVSDVDGLAHIRHMHNEIEKARFDKDHPLHISKTKKSEFVHGLNGHNDGASEETTKRAEDTYYNNLKKAAYTINKMANHKDFKHHWKNKDILTGSGRTRPELSDNYKNEGVRGAGATSKSDVITIRSREKGHKALKLISLKDEKGSQLMSSSPAEFSAIYKHALKRHHEAGHISRKDYDDHVATIDKIKEHLKKGDHVTANSTLKKLHEKLGGGRDRATGKLKDHKFSRAVHHEAITGEGKFKTKEGTATHVVTIGKNASVDRVGDFLDKHEGEGNLQEARAGTGKHRGTSTAVRLDTPKSKSEKIKNVIKKVLGRK